MIDTVATILDETRADTIQAWFELAEDDSRLMAVPMSREDRCAHLPKLFSDIVSRLRSSTIPGTVELVSGDAAHHGLLRRRQGYSAAMLVEESRMLQISIFDRLQKNLQRLDTTVMMLDVMTIANEVDAQLSRAMTSYVEESLRKSLTQPAGTAVSAD